MPPLRRLLVLSLGNPPPYAETLHSAGHIALSALQRLLPDQPPFSPSRLSGSSKTAKSLVSAGPRYTLAQSPTLMNVSGPWVARAYREELARLGQGGPEELGLVLVHDDLEEALGAVRTRSWGSSHRGHNGVKSARASLHEGKFPGARWARICVGIGRPEGRDSGTVAEYVLRPVSRFQRGVLEGTAAEGVLEALLRLEAEWEGR